MKDATNEGRTDDTAAETQTAPDPEQSGQPEAALPPEETRQEPEESYPEAEEAYVEAEEFSPGPERESMPASAGDSGTFPDTDSDTAVLETGSWEGDMPLEETPRESEESYPETEEAYVETEEPSPGLEAESTPASAGDSGTFPDTDSDTAALETGSWEGDMPYHDESGVAEETAVAAAAPPPVVPPPSRRAREADTEEEDEEERELGARMTFLEHLDELRKRILYSIIALAVGFAVCWGFREQIFNFIRYPIDQVLKQLVITKPTEAFTIYMKVAFVGGIFVAAPVILIQVWMFIAPGLYRREKRFALPFLASSTALFLLGAAFAYYIVLPPALQFLIIDFGSQFMPMITAMDYFDLVFLIVVGMGAVFQLPVLIAFLSMFGLITPRFLWKNFRYAFLLIVIAAAIVSPTTDPFNLLLWTGPMVILYLIGIVVSWVFKRRRAKREAAGL